MKNMQIAAILISLLLIFLNDLGQSLHIKEFGYYVSNINPYQGIVIAFWAVVVFLYFFVRFHSWAIEPPVEFSRTPPRHCTTGSRYISAQLCYAGVMVAIFFLLVFVPHLVDQVVLFAKHFFNDPGVSKALEATAKVTAAFDDPNAKSIGLTSSARFSDYTPQEMAPFAAFLLILVYARLPIFREQKVRSFFQESALIPFEANSLQRIINGCGSGFTPHPQRYREVLENRLRGILAPGPCQEDMPFRDIVVAEYILNGISSQEDREFLRARGNSNYQNIAGDMDSALAASQHLVADGVRLIKIFEGQKTGKMQSWQGQLEVQLGNVLEAVLSAHAGGSQPDHGKTEFYYTRLTDDIAKLNSIADQWEQHRLFIKDIYAIHSDYALRLEEFVERVLISAHKIRGQVLAFTAGEPGEDEGRKRTLSESLLETVVALERMADDIVKELAAGSSQEINLNWIDAYQKRLRGEAQQVFNWSFKPRQMELLSRYRRLRKRIELLLITLVLASDRSAGERVQRFKNFGFPLKTTTSAIPPYMLAVTFVAVFLVCLASTLIYWGVQEYLPSFSGMIPDTGLVQEVTSQQDISANLKIDEPQKAVIWSAIGASMHMLAMFIAQMAWNLVPHPSYQKNQEQKRMSTYMKATVSGFVFGFFANVVLYFFLGILMGSPELLENNWEWSLLGGTTGAFLLLQGVNIRHENNRAFKIVWIVQGLVSGFLAFCIAWIWGFHRAGPEVLGPFMVYVLLNMTLVGMTLGWLAKYFMVDERLVSTETADAQNELAVLHA